MKKTVSLVLALIMVVSFALTIVSCNNQKGDVVKVVNIALTTEKYAFAVKKGNSELLASLNTFLAKIVSNGSFDTIVNKYFGDGTPTPVVSGTKDPAKNQLVVATNAAFEPFEYMSGSNYLGVDMEIMSLFAAELDKELVIDNMNFEAVCTSVGSGLCDVAAAGLTIKPDREEILDFSTSYYDASQMLVCLASETAFDKCTSVAEVEAIIKAAADGTKIGVQNSTTGQFYVKGDADWGFDGFQNINCVGYANGALAVQDMINGNIKYVIIDNAPASHISASYNGKK